MTGPLDLGDSEVKVTSLAVKVSDAEFADRHAAYRNELARQQGKKLDRQWSKKSQLEAYLANCAAAARDSLKVMLEEVGPFPRATGDSKADEKAMRAYVANVIAWDKKHK